ncbi:unnamed protein product, partial [Adineta steineri]
TTATTTTSTTTTSTTSTTTTSTTSTTTTSTSTTTSATTATTTTTTAQEYVTVIVSDSTKDNSGILGLGLGLGLPLVLAFAALTFYALHRRQSVSSGVDSRVELFESAETSINQPESIEKLSENNNNSLSDATDNRQELKSTTNENLTNPEPQLLNGNSFTAVSISDFELHGLQRTTAASLFSSPISDLPSDNVQHTQQFSLDMNNFQPTGSILVRAYTQQGKDNSINSS